ncbi:hypothetical protein ID858_09605 [Xenorhabdus sp. DI]|uniref:hypothetical protein n=1 Tax=Xenorhabdus doucetiae TaxID=351671 RepID=UPI0019972EEE|nr:MULTISPECIES: hypothetical protein [unclassified Xenorhabdus]MBD2783066.1 hypothetical protein [Xenorhabdus sp. 3]MBD2788766.1 hypothetical protein [Xenorhabdus sp. DI]MBD2795730.1 hypothetical protein [Xenorhabdus sp. 18]
MAITHEFNKTGNIMRLRNKLFLLFLISVNSYAQNDNYVINPLGLSTQVRFAGITDNGEIFANMRDPVFGTSWEGARVQRTGFAFTPSKWGNGFVHTVSHDGYVLSYKFSIADMKYRYTLASANSTVDMGFLGEINGSPDKKDNINIVGREIYMSSKGKVIAYTTSRDTTDFLDENNHPYHQYLPSFYKNGKLTRLPVMSGFRDGYMNGISNTGDIMVGYYNDGAGNNQAFKYENDATIKLKNIGGTNSRAEGISGDGKVIIGASTISDKSNIIHAVKWVGKEVIDLGIGNEDDASIAKAVNRDGTIIAGDILTDTDKRTSGTAFVSRNGEIKGLDPIRKNSATGVTGMSPDGDVIWGHSSSQNVVWVYDKDGKTNLYGLVDTGNSYTSVQLLGSDIFSSFEKQAIYLDQLQRGCYTTKKGNVCYNIFTDKKKNGHLSDVDTGISIGYGVNDNLSVGVSFDKGIDSLSNYEYIKENGNVGVGLFASWNKSLEDGAWYVQAGAGANKVEQNINRPVLENTEAADGKTKVSGFSANIMAGRIYDLNNGAINFHSGLKYTNILRKGYTESHAKVPFTFDDMKDETLKVALGAGYEFELFKNLKLNTTIEARLNATTNNNKLTYSAYSPYIGYHENERKRTFPEGTLTTELEYSINDSANIKLIPALHRTSTGEYVSSFSLGISGEF